MKIPSYYDSVSLDVWWKLWANGRLEGFFTWVAVESEDVSEITQEEHTQNTTLGQGVK